MIMNAFEIYSAAFDAAQGDARQATAEYVLDYADGALEISISQELAQKIADVRADYVARAESGDIGSDWIYRNVREILEEIEI